ncbi:MAG: 2-C-methyl-D-erythritol 2,4-cyclodiphosphate synthase, partial [Phycisphaerales bacterium JB038]
MAPQPRIGLGYDLHRLQPVAADAGPPVKALVLGGIRIEHDHGPISHSDGDVLLHALTDAILGALGEPDIGTLFPDTAPENAGRASRDFLLEAKRRLAAAGLAIGNIDLTLIMERPRISPHKEGICDHIASLLGIERERVN